MCPPIYLGVNLNHEWKFTRLLWNQDAEPWVVNLHQKRNICGLWRLWCTTQRQCSPLYFIITFFTNPILSLFNRTCTRNALGMVPYENYWHCVAQSRRPNTGTCILVQWLRPTKQALMQCSNDNGGMITAMKRLCPFFATKSEFFRRQFICFLVQKLQNLD